MFARLGWNDGKTESFAFTAIEIAWEASLAIYLIVKGYRPSPLLAEPTRV